MRSVSAHIFELFIEFEIVNVCNLYSNVHHPLSFSLSSSNRALSKVTGVNHAGVQLQYPNKTTELCGNIETVIVNSIKSKPDGLGGRCIRKKKNQSYN